MPETFCRLQNLTAQPVVLLEYFFRFFGKSVHEVTIASMSHIISYDLKSFDPIIRHEMILLM
jgi:hypothetical protein